MKKKLLMFGDSWPNGEELDLSQDKTFGELVAIDLSLEFVNYSRSSTSIPHLILQLQNAIINNDCNQTSIPLFFLTSPSRDLVFTYHQEDDKYANEDLQHENPNSQWWYRRGHTPMMEIYRTNTTLIALQKICEIYNLNSFFIWGWERVELWPEVDTQHFYPLSCAEMFDSNFTNFTNLKNSNNKYLNIGGHPNQMGHQLIANNLTKFIKEKLTSF